MVLRIDLLFELLVQLVAISLNDLGYADFNFHASKGGFDLIFEDLVDFIVFIFFGTEVDDDL